MEKIVPVTLQIYYYMPDYSSLIQEFVWQMDDNIPRLYRVHRFLNYWKQNIPAVIKEIQICHPATPRPTAYRNVEHFLKLS